MALQATQADPKAHIRLQANLRTLQRSDPTITEILDLSTYAVCYQWDDEGDEGWEKQKVEGPLFVVQRDTVPAHSLFLLNRLAPRNLQIHLPQGDIRPSKVGDKMLQISKRGSKQKLGIWIDEGSSTVDRFIDLVTRICGPVNPSTSVLSSATPVTSSATSTPVTAPVTDDALSKLFAVAGLLPSNGPTPAASATAVHQTTTTTTTTTTHTQESTSLSVPSSAPAPVTQSVPQDDDLLRLLGLAPSTSTSAAPTPSAPSPAPSPRPQTSVPESSKSRRRKKGSSTPDNEASTPAPVPAELFPRLAPANSSLRDSGYIPSNAENEARSLKRSVRREQLVHSVADGLEGTGVAADGEGKEGRREFVRGLLELIHTDEAFVDELWAAYKARG